MRTRMWGAVGTGGENPPVTRLCCGWDIYIIIVSEYHVELIRTILLRQQFIHTAASHGILHF
jgi:hypothetical protein